jgi:hypothetical protein
MTGNRAGNRPILPAQAEYQRQVTRAAEAFEAVIAGPRLAYGAAITAAAAQGKTGRIPPAALEAWAAACQRASEAAQAIRGPAEAAVDQALKAAGLPYPGMEEK